MWEQCESAQVCVEGDVHRPACTRHPPAGSISQSLQGSVLQRGEAEGGQRASQRWMRSRTTPLASHATAHHAHTLAPPPELSVQVLPLLC